MRRPLALRPEIVEHFRQTRAEELAPRPVDERSGGQRVVMRHEPVREIEARRARAHVVLPLGSLLRTRAPAPAIGGHANGSAASTSRKRPMDARRSSESCRSVTTIVESAVVLTGPANRSARNGFRASPKRMPHAVFGLPSIAASGGMLGSVVLDGTDGGVSFTVAMVNGILRPACPVSTSSAL